MSDTLHGGALTEMMTRFPNAPQPWLDLSTGINPMSYPIPQLPTELWQRLPEAEHVSAAARARAGCEALRGLLAELGLQVEGDGVLYVSILSPEAPSLWENLARQGIYVRRFADDGSRLRFGLPADHHEFNRLRTALWCALWA